MPDFELEQVEDFYVLYVHIVGISEEVFWNAPIPFVKTVALNKQAYDGWLAREQAKLLEER